MSKTVSSFPPFSPFVMLKILAQSGICQTGIFFVAQFVAHFVAQMDYVAHVAQNGPKDFLFWRVSGIFGFGLLELVYFWPKREWL